MARARSFALGRKVCSSKRFHYGGRPTHDEVGAGIDDDLVEALGVLVESFNGDVALSPFGRFAVGAFLQGIVEKQIALATRFRAEPALAERAIRRPIFVAGLPRTGTTLLHNLLSQAPQTLALRTGNSPPRRGNYSSAFNAVRNQVGSSRVAAMGEREHARPQEVHPIAAENNEECTLLLMNSLTNVGFQLLAPLVRYDQWLRQLSPARLTAVYELHRRYFAATLGRSTAGTLASQSTGPFRLAARIIRRLSRCASGPHRAQSRSGRDLVV